MQSSELLKLLRTQFKDIEAYVIPSADEHQSEYTADYALRRKAITNFTGSAGTAVVTKTKAALWTDGRYWNQANYELDPNHWILMKDGDPDTPSISQWLGETLIPGSNVGIDPKLFNFNQFDGFERNLAAKRLNLVGIAENLVDKVWSGQPGLPKSKIFPYHVEFSGISWRDKVDQVRNEMKQEGASILLVTLLDEIAWLFNIRASDVEYNPVFLSYAIITHEKSYLFLNDTTRLDSALLSHLGYHHHNGAATASDQVTLLEYNQTFSVLQTQINDLFPEDTCWIPKNSSYFAFSQIDRARLHQTEWSPISRLKAVKNDVELHGMRKAHVKDAVALTEFFYWLQQSKDKGIDEVDASDHLDGLRSKQENSISLSFSTISSSGPNGAVIHYRPHKGTCSVIDPSKIYLCDSGGQYLEGTTDVTRTVHMGEPTQHEKEMFTRVLKGHIALARARFPRKSPGSRLDTLARQFLWEVGCDYQHGTGHGVGCFLNVHEGPISISTRLRSDDLGLLPGMILSNEPGYYEDGNMGIRIENLVEVVKSSVNPERFCELKNLTLFPIQRKMIVRDMLTRDEVAWLNSYHNLVYTIVGQEITSQGKSHDLLDWLRSETTPLV